MNSVRSTLEDWMALEISRDQLKGPEFFDVYYHELPEHDTLWDRANSSAGVMIILDTISQKLKAAYPDCAPLRRLLNKIEISKKFTKEYKPRHSKKNSLEMFP